MTFLMMVTKLVALQGLLLHKWEGGDRPSPAIFTSANKKGHNIFKQWNHSVKCKTQNKIHKLAERTR